MTIDNVYNSILITCNNDIEYEVAFQYIHSMIDEFIEAVWEIGFDEGWEDCAINNGVETASY